MLRELGLERHPQMVPILNDLALTLAQPGRLTEALALIARTVALDSAIFGPSHPYLATHLENLGYVYDRAGFGDSAKLHRGAGARDAAGGAGGRQPGDRPDAVQPRVAGVHARSYRAAEPLYEEALLRMRRAYGPEHTDVVYATGSLGRNQYYLGRRAEAERNLRWALSVTNPDRRAKAEWIRRASAGSTGVGALVGFVTDIAHRMFRSASARCPR